MALEDRTVDLILKAEIGQALKPLAEMVTQVKALSTAIKEQQEAARNGSTSLTDYSKSVNGMKDAAGELLKARVALDQFAKQTTTVDLRQGRVDMLRQARDEAVAAAPDVNQRTAAQQTAIDRRDKALATAERQAQNINAQYARTVDLLTQMGILSDKLAASQQRLAIDAAHSQITTSGRDAGAALAQARAFDAEAAIRNAKTLAEARIEADAENARRTEASASIARAAAARASAAAPPPVPVTATGQVGTLLSGLDRASVGVVTDVEAATDKLVVTLGKAGLTAQSFNQAMDQVFATQRRIAQDASLIDSYRALDASIIKATEDERLAVVELQRVAAAHVAGTASANELRRAEAGSGAASVELARQVAQQKSLAEQLKARKIDTANLDVETRKLVATTERLATAQRGATSAGSKFLGLDAFQFQNLQFQINDVITQLSLGQGVLRTFEAQGGQIFQIFQLTVGQMKQLVLYGLPVVATIGLIALAFARVGETVAAQRGFAGLIAGSINATAQSARELTEIAREAERTGLAFKDAREAVTEFTKQGLNPAAIRQMVQAVTDLSLGLSLKPADVTKELAVIASGSAEELRKLLQTYQALNPALDAYIREQERSGNLDLARQATLDALSTRGREAVDKGLSPITAATIELKNAWHGLLDTMSSEERYKTTIENLAGVIRAAKEAIDWIAKVLPFRSVAVPQAGTPEFDKTVRTLNESAVAKAAKQLKDIQDQIKQLNQSPILPEGATKNALLDRLKEQLIAAQFEYDALAKKRDDFNRSGGTTSATPGSAFEGTPTPDRGAAGRNTTAAIAEAHLGQNLAQVAPFLGQQNTDQIVNAWCAAFANAALKQAGLAGSGSNVATSFERWGQAVAAGAVQAGDILVQARGHPAGEPGGHVGIATGQTKVGPGGGLLVEMISGNLGGKVSRTFEEASGLDVRRATAAQFTPPGAPLGRAGGDAAAANQAESQMLIDKINTQIDTTLKGNSAAKIKQDKEIADAEQRRVKKEADDVRKTGDEDTANIALRERLDATFRENQKRLRDKEDAELKTRAEGARAAAEALTLADPTNVEGRQKAAALKFTHALDDLDTLVKEGVTQIGGTPITTFRDQLLKLKDEAVLIAKAEAEVAGVQALVKDRDAQIEKIKEDGKRAGVEASKVFADIGRVVAEFAPRIAAAREVASRDVAALPPSPKRSEQQAELAKVRPQDEKAFTDQDEAQLQKINDIVAARSAIERRLTTDVSNYRRTQQSADVEIQKAYNAVRPLIRAQSEELLKQLETQRELGQIGPEAYEKMKAKIEETVSAANNLTAAQRKFLDAMEGVVSGAFVKAFDTITTSIGKALNGTEKWGDALKDIGRAFQQLVADILKGIAEIIIKEIIVAEIKTLFKAAFLHGGGTVGSPGGMSRAVDPMIFLGAARAHGGALVGLSSNEVPAILQTGEEVLSKSDSRNRLNGGMRSGKSEGTSMPNIRQVLVMDPSQVSGALSGSHGERVVLTHIKNNSGAIRGILNQR